MPSILVLPCSEGGGGENCPAKGRGGRCGSCDVGLTRSRLSSLRAASMQMGCKGLWEAGRGQAAMLVSSQGIQQL